MDKKKRKVYTPAEKRRRNRRHNAIVTSIAVVLMLAGIIIIVSDTTFFFDDAGRWIRRNIFGEVFEGTTGEVAAFESDIVIDSISGSRYCPCIAVPLLNVPGWLTFGSPPTHP